MQEKLENIYFFNLKNKNKFFFKAKSSNNHILVLTAYFHIGCKKVLIQFRQEQLFFHFWFET